MGSEPLVWGNSPGFKKLRFRAVGLRVQESIFRVWCRLAQVDQLRESEREKHRISGYKFIVLDSGSSVGFRIWSLGFQ